MGSLNDQDTAIACVPIASTAPFTFSPRADTPPPRLRPLCSDLLEVLDAHRDNCERLGKYVEAEIARKRIDELKGHEEARRKEAMRARQLAEVLAVEEGHMMEFQQFNAMWDAKMQAYETNGGQLIQAMRVRARGGGCAGWRWRRPPFPPPPRSFSTRVAAPKIPAF